VEFGPVPTEHLVGCILGHNLRLPTGVLKKGRVLSREDVEHIDAAGLTAVTVARLGADDVIESLAAQRLAHSICGVGIECEEPFTGRVNLHATRAGILKIDTATANALLDIDEGLTFSTLVPGSTVWAHQLVATAKVIPFAVLGAVVGRWERRARSQPPCIAVAPFHPHSATFIQTCLPGTHETVLERASASMRARLAARGSELETEVRCAHERSEIALQISGAVSAGADLIAILGASQTADRADVVPRAIVEAGGVVHRFGLPMDPGNLTLIASVGDVTVLGVPGCARSARPSGFDRVLDRALAGTRAGDIEVVSLGVGGLLKEIASRPQPRRDRTHVSDEDAPQTPTDLEG